jgi:hypothetical protein
VCPPTVSDLSSGTSVFYELDQRRDDRLTTTLEWDRATGNVQVRCEDTFSPDESFSYSVDPRKARLAFLDPFALRPVVQDPDLSDGGRYHGRFAVKKRWRRLFLQRIEARTDRAFSESWTWWLI